MDPCCQWKIEKLLLRSAAALDLNVRGEKEIERAGCAALLISAAGLCHGEREMAELATWLQLAFGAAALDKAKQKQERELLLCLGQNQRREEKEKHFKSSK